MRVLVAMSGGVDSAVAAGLLAEAGHAVIGATLQLYDHGAATGRRGACCAGQDIHDARDAAQALGIPHYVLDRQDRFRSAVIEDFADSYARGETPVPCVRCNQTVKFEDLLELARDLGCAALATGHYARRVEGPRGPELHRAADPARDQSYFLHATTPAQLAFARFPLGDLPDKAAVRAHAARLGLALSAKPDSQDLCFVPAGRYDAVATALRPEAGRPGEIVHRDGRVLGRHAGIVRYTVGQGRGLGGASFDGGERLAVHAIDAARRRVVVGPRALLPRAAVSAGAVNWLAPPPPGPFRAEVRLRARGAPVPATLRFDPGGEGGRGLLTALLDRPDVASPGQALVAYAGARLLCGGTLRAPAPAAADAAASAVDSVPPPAYVGAPAGTAA